MPKLVFVASAISDTCAPINRRSSSRDSVERDELQRACEAGGARRATDCHSASVRIERALRERTGGRVVEKNRLVGRGPRKLVRAQRVDVVALMGAPRPAIAGARNRGVDGARIERVAQRVAEQIEARAPPRRSPARGTPTSTARGAADTDRGRRRSSTPSSASAAERRGRETTATIRP